MKTDVKHRLSKLEMQMNTLRETLLAKEGRLTCQVIWEDAVEPASDGLILHLPDGDVYYTHSELKQMKRKRQFIELGWGD